MDPRKACRESFELLKIDTRLNTADLCTKSLAVEASESHLRRMGFEIVSGRSAIAKKVVRGRWEPVRKWTAPFTPPSRRGDSRHGSS